VEVDMEKEGILKNSQIIVLGLCIAAATVFSSFILSGAIIKIKKIGSEVISVTGSAEKNIISDYVVWRLEFTRRGPLMIAVYKIMQRDLEIVKAYLVSKGIEPKDFIVSQINTMALYKRNEKGYDTNEIEGYQLTQAIEIRSTDVGKITEMSRESTELINQDVQLYSYPPEYFYTKLNELKLQLLSDATKNAKERAKNMAKSAGNRIGTMRSAKLGVFQITPVNSNAVSDYGINDTTSVEKKVTAVVNVVFAIKE
jgi:hypothetical protein